MRREDHFITTYTLSLYFYTFLFNYSLLLTFVLSFFTAYLSWLPDIDIKVLKKLDKLRKEKKIIYFLFFPLIFLLRLFFKHRTFTHTFWIPFSLILLDLFVLDNGFLKLIVRIFYMSLLLHILEDSLTKTGVRPFYPEKFTLKIPIFSTNDDFHSFLIKMISLVLLALYFLLIFKN